MQSADAQFLGNLDPEKLADFVEEVTHSTQSDMDHAALSVSGQGRWGISIQRKAQTSHNDI